MHGFDRFKVDSVITVTHRDVCGKFSAGGGFLVNDHLGPGQADAVFLDLPEPWLALEHAKEVLRPGRNLCSYSPCIGETNPFLSAHPHGRGGFMSH